MNAASASRSAPVRPQAGAITHETLLYALRDGEIVSPTLDVDAEVERTKLETADRPPVL